MAWRRFRDASPAGGLSGEKARIPFGELWFLAVWLLPHGVDHVKHWFCPTGARRDFAWSGLAVEAKATTSAHGQVHRIDGLDWLDAPADGRLMAFSVRMREEVATVLRRRSGHSKEWHRPVLGAKCMGRFARSRTDPSF